MAKDIKLSKSQKYDDIGPFMTVERNQILDEMQEKYPHYFPYTFFLFNTGYRTSEATGLYWDDISSGSKVITFQRVVVESENGRIIKDGLKTQAKRQFPCNERLQQFLSEQCQKSKSKIVFPGRMGGYIRPDNFRNRV